MMTVSELRVLMDGLTDDAQVDAWMRMFSAEDPADNMIPQVVVSEDPVLKILLARFLGTIPELAAVEALATLLQDTNHVIYEGARKAFDQNTFAKKWPILLPLLKATEQHAQCYAISKLASAGIWDAMPILLKLLTTDDEALLVHLLKGLRYFVDERLIPHIQPFLEDPREAVRLPAVLVLGALYEGEIRRARDPLFLALKDDSAQVRRAVIWSLRRAPAARDVAQIYRMGTTDPDPAVRQEVLMLLPFFPKKKYVTFLLDIFMKEKERSVLLKAEAIIMAMPTPLLSTVLWTVVRRSTGKPFHRALLILAEISSTSPRFIRFIFRRLKRGKKPKELLPLLEAVGLLEDPAAAPQVAQHLKGNPLLAYTAMQSLLKIWAHHPQSVDIHVHLQDPEISDLLKQTILKQMLKTGAWDFYAETMLDTLLAFLDSPTLNVRYLAAQTIAPVPSLRVMENFVGLLMREPDPTFVVFLRKSLQEQLTTRPEWMAKLIHRYKENPEYVRLLFAVMGESKIIGKPLRQMLRELLQPPLLLHQSMHKDTLTNYVAMLLLQKKIDLEECLEGLADLPGRGDLLAQLARIARDYSHVTLNPPVPTLVAWFDDPEPASRHAIIDLLTYSGDIRAIRFLTTIGCRDALQPFHDGAVAGVSHLVRSST
jgi:hypothetical protein